MRATDKQLDWIQSEYLARTQRPKPGVNIPPKAADLAGDFRRRFRKRVSAQWIATVVRLHFRGWQSERQSKSLLTWAQARFVIETYKRVPVAETVKRLNNRFDLNLKKTQIKLWLTGRGITTNGRRTGQFKPGHKPVNKQVAIGEERIRVDRGRPQIVVQSGRRNPYSGHDGFIMRKALLVWEEANGPVPKGHAIVHVDGDWRNCDLDNLACVSRAELARLNQMGWSDLPPDRDIRMAAIHTAKLKQKAFDLKPSRGYLWAQKKNACN